MKRVFVSLLLLLTSGCMYASDLYSPKQRGEDRAAIRLIKTKHRHKDRFGKKMARKWEALRDQHLSSTNPTTKKELLAKSIETSKKRRGKA